MSMRYCSAPDCYSSSHIGIKPARKVLCLMLILLTKTGFPQMTEAVYIVGRW